MLQIVYFSQKEQFLKEMETIPGPRIYVAPSPAKADGLRTRLSGRAAHDVITIAKFTSDLVEALWRDEARPAVKRKSELLLIFGILKNKYLPELGYEQFTQAYNLFSDLRSFNLNPETLSPVLDEQPPVIRDAVLLFWKLLEVTGFYDEHGAYREIAERLRSAEALPALEKTYVFWGFQHLNGQQVDLLKALAIRYPVVVPFPRKLREKLKRSDWPSWLRDVRTEERELLSTDPTPRGLRLAVNSRELALHLRDHLRDGDQVVLGVAKLTPSHIDLVPSRNVFFKVSHQVLANELLELRDELKKFRGTHRELEVLCGERLRSAPTLKHLRAWQLYGEALGFISGLTDEPVPVDAFFLKVLGEVVALNQPRTSFVPTAPTALTIDLKDMSSLETLDRRRRVILCIDERFEDIQGLGQNYTESIQRALAALGPLKRNELELLFRQWEFRDLFAEAEVLVLMNEATLKHSLVWKRLFADVALTPLEADRAPAARELRDHLRTTVTAGYAGSLSASKLQTYLDCPRKFYYSYVDPVFPDVVLERDFDPGTSGTIIHEIIEGFFKARPAPVDLRDLVRRVMDAHVAKRRLRLPPEVYLQRELVFRHRAANGIGFVRDLEDLLGEPVEWRIEEAFRSSGEPGLRGRIDCLGISARYVLLLDFKSTESAAATSTEVAELTAIQLWAYAAAASELVPEFAAKTVVLGYVVLDDAGKSNLILSDDELAVKLRDAKLCKTHKLKDEFPVALRNAEEALAAAAAAIRAARTFPAAPRTSGACGYCELNKVCIKSETTDGPDR
jgi:hypothetical protein